MILPVANSLAEQVWPDDFVRMDDAKMRVHPDWLEQFYELQWTSVDAVMRSRVPQVFRRVERDE